MITSTRVLPLAVAATALLVAGLTGCTAASPPTVGVETSASLADALALEPSEPPTPDEATPSDLEAQLLYLIEEEKLAHDVYSVLGDLWGGNIFANIAAAELSHQEAVAGLLVDHAITDPRSDDIGVFTDPQLQALFDQLVADGSASRDAAIDVGVVIEQTDIADLTEALSDAPEDVASVLERLLAGSQNHLAAFTRQA